MPTIFPADMWGVESSEPFAGENSDRKFVHFEEAEIPASFFAIGVRFFI